MVSLRLRLLCLSTTCYHYTTTCYHYTTFLDEYQFICLQKSNARLNPTS